MGVRELNVVIELWSMAFGLLGLVSAILLSRTNQRLYGLLLSAFALEVLYAGGDAVAGICRGKEGGLAWVGTHAGNLTSFVAGFILVSVMTFYTCVRIREAGGHAGTTYPTLVELASLVMCLLAAFGVFYLIDENNLYQRQNLYWLSQAFVLAASCANSLLVFRERRALGHVTSLCLLLYSLVPIASSVLQILVYGLNFMVIASTFILMVVFLELQSYSANELVQRTSELARSQLELSESRLATLVSQIQPDFLFATLDVLYDLCEESPRLAQQGIDRFSRFLDTTINSLSSTTPVLVEDELDHVCNYLELERLNRGRALEYRINATVDGFQVPPLCIQTIVEGVMHEGMLEEGATTTVTVSTGEARYEYWASIVDDGTGFDYDSLEESYLEGIRNNRTRLMEMCGGTLDISSSPGRGTTTLIHIPKRSDDA